MVKGYYFHSQDMQKDRILEKKEKIKIMYNKLEK